MTRAEQCRAAALRWYRKNRDAWNEKRRLRYVRKRPLGPKLDRNTLQRAAYAAKVGRPARPYRHWSQMTLEEVRQQERS